MTILNKASAEDCLSWESMTTAINEIKSPQDFLRTLIFGRQQTWPTETINLSFWQRGRKIAPFVKRNSEALIISGVTKDFHAVVPPNIRIKLPMTAFNRVFKRTPGTGVMIEGGAQQRAIQEAIALDQQVLANDATNSEEFLAAFALQGVVSYVDVAGDIWTVTFPKPAGNTFNAAPFWNDPDPTAPKPLLDIKAAKRVISDEVSLQPSTMILGEEASDAFLNLPGLIDILDKQNSIVGTLDFTTFFQESGAIFLGRIGGLNVFEYSRSIDVNGVDTPLIRPKFAEIVTTQAAARNVMHYAAIDDMDAVEQGLIETRRFSKTWITPDPSVRWNLLHSAPLAVPERPGAHVSIKVVSG